MLKYININTKIILTVFFKEKVLYALIILLTLLLMDIFSIKGKELYSSSLYIILFVLFLYLKFGLFASIIFLDYSSFKILILLWFTYELLIFVSSFVILLIEFEHPQKFAHEYFLLKLIIIYIFFNY